MSRTNGPETKHLRNYKPSAWLIDRVDLDFRLAPRRTEVRSRLAVRPNPESEPGPLVLNGEQLRLEQVALDGRQLTSKDWVLGGETLTIRDVPPGPFTLDIVCIVDPDANKALSGLYRSNGVYCTQCEPEGFRHITYLIDRPDVLSIYTVRIEADRDVPVLLANGNPADAGELDDERHFAVWHDPHPKPSYLFALVGGDLALVRDGFTTASGREVDLRIYVEHGKEDRCAFAMESLKKAMRWDEERFGREYDLDVFSIVAVSDFNMGAMENKGLNIFNDKLILARPDTATDGDYGSIEGVIAHEYFHNWTGNRVTCRDWFQLCLKEGLTVFRDQEFTAELRSGPVKRILDVRMLKTHQFAEDAGPLAHPVRPDSYIEINNFYTPTVYEKGAELCRMLQTMLGRDGFRAGLDLYFDRHDGRAVTVEDFLAAMSDANSRDLSTFMRWYEQAGTPELVCSLAYDAPARQAELRVAQIVRPTPGQAQKEPMPIPLKLALLGQNGAEIPLVLDDGTALPDGVLGITEREQTFRFRDVPSRPTPSLLRGFSAPVRLTLDLEPEQRAFLLAHDTDAFTRWQAAQDAALRLLERAAGERRPIDGDAAPFARSLESVIADETLEHAFRAELLRLPSESDIAREIGADVDPDAVHASREDLKQALGRELRGTLEDIYDGCASDEPFSPDADSAGRRSLRNAALELLSANGGLARAAAHYESASNMTDAVAALAILTHTDGPERSVALQHFYARWKDEPLVLDKWFAIQAISAVPQAVENTEALLAHPKFSLKTPNRVRALVGNFANANPVGFHRADGAGYRIIADCVRQLDGFNPQVAARLLGSFKSWRMFEPGRREAARATLEGLLSGGNLSRDAYEIASKTLA